MPRMVFQQRRHGLVVAALVPEPARERPARPGTLSLDALAHARDLEPLAVVETAAVDEPRPDLLETGRERPRTRHGPGLDEGLPLPDLRARAVIRLEGLDGAHQRPLVPRGPEPHVDPVGEAFARRGLKRADRALRDAREELVRRRAAAPPGRIPGVVDEDEVEVGVVRELLGAELSHPEHRVP